MAVPGETRSDFDADLYCRLRDGDAERGIGAVLHASCVPRKSPESQVRRGTSRRAGTCGQWRHQRRAFDYHLKHLTWGTVQSRDLSLPTLDQGLSRLVKASETPNSGDSWNSPPPQVSGQTEAGLAGSELEPILVNQAECYVTVPGTLTGDGLLQVVLREGDIKCLTVRHLIYGDALTTRGWIRGAGGKFRPRIEHG